MQLVLREGRVGVRVCDGEAEKDAEAECVIVPLALSDWVALALVVQVEKVRVTAEGVRVSVAVGGTVGGLGVRVEVGLGLQGNVVVGVAVAVGVEREEVQEGLSRDGVLERESDRLMVWERLTRKDSERVFVMVAGVRVAVVVRRGVQLRLRLWEVVGDRDGGEGVAVLDAVGLQDPVIVSVGDAETVLSDGEGDREWGLSEGVGVREGGEAVEDGVG